ncbi:transposase [Streptomyces sp. NPDC001714]|uniref:transposase n=1 Tax=Streptomyces sp. NPDC001714 TaxID=3364603 RepID=UPI003692C5F4
MTAGRVGRSRLLRKRDPARPLSQRPVARALDLIEPVLTSWRDQRHARALDIGRPPEHDLRQIMNAILYVDRTGIP